jgi:hypothetical protein
MCAPYGCRREVILYRVIFSTLPQLCHKAKLGSETPKGRLFCAALWHKSCTSSRPTTLAMTFFIAGTLYVFSKPYRRNKMLKKLTVLFGVTALAVTLTAAPALAQQTEKSSEKQTSGQTEKEKKEADSKASSTSAGSEKQESKSQEKPQPK